ncbi:MAG: VanZ family protein [Thermoanaerobaculia bacterium]
MHRIHFVRLSALSWAIVTGILLTLPGGSFSSSSRLIPFLTAAGMDKVVHFVLFSVMAWLAYLAFRDVDALRFPVPAACGFALAYGLILEGLQFYIPERFPSFADVLADGVGVLVAGVVINQVERRRNCSSSK